MTQTEPHPLTQATSWVRTRRLNSTTGLRVPGPWHVLWKGYGMTWCGRRPSALVASERMTLPPQTVPNETRCPGCERAMAKGTPTPYRRGR